MHVMIATDGNVNPAKGARAVAGLSRDGKVTLLTVVEVPRALFAQMRAAAADESGDATTATFSREGVPQQGVAASAWMGDDAAIERYVRAATVDATGPIIAELVELGVEYELVVVESEDASDTILAEVVERDVDILCIGTHGLGRFDGLLGSISTKLARRAACSVLLIR